MKRKILTTITALLLVSSMSTNAFAEELLIDFNGMNRILKETTVENEIIYVEAKEFCDLFGINYEFRSYNREIALSKDGAQLIMNYNLDVAKFNGRSIASPKPIIEIGLVMIPMEFVAEKFGIDMSYNSSTKKISFGNDDVYLSNINDVGKKIDEKTKVFTYNEALTKAKTNNSSISKINSTLFALESNLEVTKDSMTLYGDSQFHSLVTSMKTLETNITNSENALELLDTASELTLISSIVPVKLTELSIVLLEESLKSSETDLKNLKLKLDLGMATTNEVSTKSNEIEQSKIKLAQAKVDLKKMKESLNATMGVAQNLDIIVEYDPVIEKKTFDVDRVAALARLVSGNVVSAENKIKAAQFAVDIDINDSVYQSVNDQPERDLIDAKRELTDAQNTAESSARTAYNNFEKARLADSSLKIAKEEAIKTYNNLAINYKAGYVTKNDLDKASLAITKAEFDIVQNLLQYNIYLFQLEHPELF